MARPTCWQSPGTSVFGLRAVTDAFRRPFEVAQIRRQLSPKSGRNLFLSSWRPVLLWGGSDAAHARDPCHVRRHRVDSDGAGTGVLRRDRSTCHRPAGGWPGWFRYRGGALSNMRATEQIDAIESLSVDSFKFLVVPRIVACTLALPLLTLFLDFSALLGGFVSEYAASRLSFQLYLRGVFGRRLVELLSADAEDGRLRIRDRHHLLVSRLHHRRRRGRRGTRGDQRRGGLVPGDHFSGCPADQVHLLHLSGDGSL